MIYFLPIIVFTFILFFHRFIWRLASYQKSQIPTGLGFYIIFFLLILNNLIDLNLNLNFFFIILIPAMIYFIDDLRSLNFKIRILLQLVGGVIIFLSGTNFIFNNDLLNILTIIFLSFLFTNSFNFNDGSDGHIALILFQLFLWNLIFIDNINNQDYILLILIFIFLFFLINLKNLSFFGDSGCYIFAILYIHLIIDNNLKDILVLFIPVFFYTIDVLYVFVLRVINKEHLLTRNYHHLYQIIDIKFGSIFYLIPGLLNNLIIFSLYKYLEIYGFYYIAFFISLFNYLIFRFFLRKFK